MMVDYGLLPADEPPGPGLVLKRTRRRLLGDTLTNTVTPADAETVDEAVDAGAVMPASGAPTGAYAPQIAQYRSRAASLFDEGRNLMEREPDISGLQALARQRGEESGNAMLASLAAQYAGPQFEQVGATFLKRALAAREPMKLAGGTLMPDGTLMKDPFASREKRVEFLLNQAKAYEQLAQSAETAQERAAATAAQNQINNQLRLMQQGISQQNADTARMMAGGGVLGAGSSQQIGSGTDEVPVFRDNAGRLFTYNQQGQPVPYQGLVNPKISSAAPTEDERKAAGWFAQADNARANMENVVKANPSAAYPSVRERAAGMVPGVGQDLANSLRSEDRQKFMQAAESMAEALLRAATGAGVNESEAAQKVRELVPQLGDKPGTVKQKMDAYKVYMDALRARAGRALQGATGGAGRPPGAAGAAAGGTGAPGASAEDPLGLRNRGGR